MVSEFTTQNFQIWNQVSTLVASKEYSEGMILAASDTDGKEVFLSTVDSGAKEGMRVM